MTHDPIRDRMNRQIAANIIFLLPATKPDADAVLAHVKELYDGYLCKPAERAN